MILKLKSATNSDTRAVILTIEIKLFKGIVSELCLKLFLVQPVT